MEKDRNFLVEELFFPTRGKSKYTRGYADKSPGEYPVYSASLSAPLCYVSEYDYDGTYLTWTTNGYGGRIQIITGKFSINGDRGILIPKIKELPEPEYIKRFLEPILIEQAVGRIVDGKKNEYTKVSPDVVAKSIITLPVNSKGDIDLSIIEKISEKIKKIDLIQNSLLKHQEQIEETEINIELKGETVDILLGNEEYFSLSIGERVLKKDVLQSGIPVYSANVNNPFGLVKYSNIENFESPSLLWGIDGFFYWNIIPAGTEFATTDHCGRLLIKSSDIDPEYVYYYLQGTRLEYGFDRVFRANLDNIRQLVHIKLPLNSKGEICLKTQKNLSLRYKNILNIKKKIVEKLSLLGNTFVDVVAY